MKKPLNVVLWSNISFLLALAWLPNVANAGMHLTLGGSNSVSNAGYQKIQAGAASGSLAFDLGDYFRLGYSYRQELSITSGYTEAKDESGVVSKDAAGDATYVKFLNMSRVTSQSVDLTVVLYAGEIFMPYVFVGVVNKNYEIDNQIEGQPIERIRLPMPASPNGGVGMGIRLNQKFSLKMSYTMSQGFKQLPGQIDPERTIDTYTQVGITYSL
jgi:hypothetical protein